MLGKVVAGSPTELCTDDSEYELGALPAQMHHDTKRVIAYGSVTFSKCERNKYETRRRLLGRDISNFRPYLYGFHFTIVADNHALCCDSKIGRRIQGFMGNGERKLGAVTS